jgi:alpha/beta superfamily hydrolase
VSVLIAIAPPVNRDGYTWERTLESEKPKFFVQGDLDELCSIRDLWAFYAKLKEPKELAVVDGASHLFEGKTREVGDALEDLLGDFE